MAWINNFVTGTQSKAGTMVTPNPESYGVIFADDISGHRRVQSKSDLYKIPTAILSKPHISGHVDAIGQEWYVADEDCKYKLINWSNRKSESGWKKVESFNTTDLDDRFWKLDQSNITTADVSKLLYKITDGIKLTPNKDYLYFQSDSSTYRIKVNDFLTSLDISGSLNKDYLKIDGSNATYTTCNNILSTINLESIDINDTYKFIGNYNNKTFSEVTTKVLREKYLDNYYATLDGSNVTEEVINKYLKLINSDTENTTGYSLLAKIYNGGNDYFGLVNINVLGNRFLEVNGSNTMQGTLDMSNNQIKNLNSIYNEVDGVTIKVPSFKISVGDVDKFLIDDTKVKSYIPIESTKFKVDGGTSTQVMMADGSVKESTQLHTKLPTWVEYAEVPDQSSGDKYALWATRQIDKEGPGITFTTTLSYRTGIPYKHITNIPKENEGNLLIVKSNTQGGSPSISFTSKIPYSMISDIPEVTRETGTPSDIRYKSNRQSLGFILNKIRKLPIFSYTWNKEGEESYNSVGTSAQAVQKLFPDIVHYNEARDVYTIEENKLGILAIRCIQEEAIIREKFMTKTNKRLDKLESQVKQLMQV
jgi:hypothetical protein